MKFLTFVLFATLFQTNSYAAGSWNLSCTSKDFGLSFQTDNGEAVIHFLEINDKGELLATKADVQIENYDLGFEAKDVQVFWVGKEEILENKYENSCNRDQAKITFKNKVKIQRKSQNILQIIDVLCEEEILTSASADSDTCLK